MIYIMSPYSSPLLELQAQRYEQVLSFTTKLLIEGLPAFSPIVYLHNIAKINGLPGDAKSWMRFNMTMLRHAELAFLLQLPGWEKSEGVKIEVNVCQMLGIEIVRYGADFRPIQ